MPESNGRFKEQTVWYRKTWVIVLFLIFFFPAGLFLMWKYAEWLKAVKVMVSGLFVGIFVLGAIFAPPSIRVDSPLSAAEGEIYTLAGKVSPANALVTVNGKPVIKDGASFRIEVKLVEGDNALTIVAVDGNKRTEERVTIHRFTKAEIAEKKAGELAKQDAQKKAAADRLAKAEAGRRRTEEAKRKADAAKATELARTQQEKSEAKRIADQISVSSTIIKKPIDGDETEHYFYWFDVTNNSGLKFNGYVEITLIGSLEDSRGTTKSEKLSIQPADTLYTGIQAIKIDSRSRPLAFGGDTQAYKYKIIFNNYTFDYPSIQPLTSKNEDLSGYN